MTFPLNLAVHPPPDQETKRIRWALLGGLYLALACAAVAGLIRMSWNLNHSYFSVGVILALLAATVPQLDPRFRVPMVPLLLVLAFASGSRSLVGDAGEVTPGARAKHPPDHLPT
jgi:peptidoglycan/LPS O-acetylase OafA/YrhL